LNLVHDFELKTVPPYSFELTVAKPAGWWWATPREVYEGRTLWTGVRWEGRLLGLRIDGLRTLMRPRIRCRVYSRARFDEAMKDAVTSLIRAALRTEEDVRPFYEMAEGDPIVREVVKDLRGMRILRWPDLFSALILAITLQMAPLVRSQQMWGLLMEHYGENAVFDGRRIRYWPSPKKISETSEEELRSVAKLGYRAKNLKAIAESILGGFPTMEELSRMPSEDARRKLMELRGVGEYSADIVGTEGGFSLDVWSAKIFGVLMTGKEPEDPRAAIPVLQRLARERWGRWTGHVFVYVLNDLDKVSERIGFDLTKF